MTLAIRPKHQENTNMPLTLFYRGLLYALCEERKGGFVADGPDFHNAFRVMLEHARQAGLPIQAEELLEDFDPVFGVSPHATEMLFEGERDYLLSLMNPTLVQAQFKLQKEEATKALDELDAAETFRELARSFTRALPAA